MLRVRASTYKFWGDTIQSITVTMEADLSSVESLSETTAPFDNLWETLKQLLPKEKVVTFVVPVRCKGEKETQTFRLETATKHVREITLGDGKWRKSKTEAGLLWRQVSVHMYCQRILITRFSFFYVFSSHFCKIKVYSFTSNSLL